MESDRSILLVNAIGIISSYHQKKTDDRNNLLLITYRRFERRSTDQLFENITANDFSASYSLSPPVSCINGKVYQLNVCMRQAATAQNLLRPEGISHVPIL